MSRKLTLGPADEASIWNFRGVKKLPRSSKKGKLKSGKPKSKSRMRQLVFLSPKQEIDLTQSDDETVNTAQTALVKYPTKVEDSDEIKDMNDEVDVIPGTPPSLSSTATDCPGFLSTGGSCSDAVTSDVLFETSHCPRPVIEKVNSIFKEDDQSSNLDNSQPLESSSGLKTLDEDSDSSDDGQPSHVSEVDEGNGDVRSELDVEENSETDTVKDELMNDSLDDDDNDEESQNEAADCQASQSSSCSMSGAIRQSQTTQEMRRVQSENQISLSSKLSKMRQSSLGSFLGVKEKCTRQASLLAYFSNPKMKSERFVDDIGVKDRRTGIKSKFEQRSVSNPEQTAKAKSSTYRRCPFYKWIPGTEITVDAFRYGSIPGCSFYFLTHFHADHYGGLTRRFKHPIYCSQATGKLVIQQLRVDASYIHILEWDTPTQVGKVQVTLFDANHCPGAAMILFELPSGQTHLHTGDFRASDRLCQEAARWTGLIDDLYLDTTYCKPEYAFPPQQETIEAVKRLVTEEIRRKPRTLIVCGAYQIGKERIFTAISEALGCSVFVRRDKHRILSCLEDPQLKAALTTDANSTQLHVVPMGHLRIDSLESYRQKQGSRYDRVLALRPTGWTHSTKRDGSSHGPVRLVEHRQKCDIYGVSYSEHSSFTELKNFVQTVRPRRIIPTVNNGSPSSREQMNNTFSQWLSVT